MRRIREEEQQANQPSIENQSMIEQYNQLEFSDEKQRDSPSSGSDKEMELSPDKLKYLGVDKFPWSYGQKMHENSDTRQDLVKKQHSNKMKYTGGQYQNQRLQDGLYSRKKHRQNKQHSFKQHKSFNIDSFLNSQPITYKHERRPSQSKIDDSRNAHNRNALEQVLQQRSKPRKQKGYNGSQNAYFHKKDVNKIFQQRNNQIKQFIDKNRGSRVQYQQPSSGRNQPIMSQSQQSITLITLPEPPQSIYARPAKKPEQHRRHNKTYSLMRYGHYNPQDRQQKQQKSSQLFQVRFQQAKISFLDSFLPDAMKIGNNPYNFWKYANSKKNNYLRIV